MGKNKIERLNGQFRAGAASREITPKVGTPLSGFIARLKVSTGIADSLFTRALVLTGGRTTLVLVQMDLLALAQWHIDQIRRACVHEFETAPENVLISTTHTHSGPGLVPVRGCLMADVTYHWQVIEKTIEAIREAHSARRAATLHATRVPFHLGVNRRQDTANGIVLGFDHRKPAPKFLNVAAVKMSNGDSCILFSHAAHPYVLGAENSLISGDFPSFACRFLEESAGTTAMFLNGCAGNIAPRRAFEGLAAAQGESERLAHAVKDAVSKARKIRALPLTARSEHVHLPHAKLPSATELERIDLEQERTVRPDERANPAVAAKTRAALQDWANALNRVLTHSDVLTPVFSEVQVLEIGSLSIVSISGEPFFETEQNILNSRHKGNTWVLGYCNAYSGYLPTRRAFSEGGYEVSDSYRYLGTWYLDPSCEHRVVKAARRLLRERHAE